LYRGHANIDHCSAVAEGTVQKHMLSYRFWCIKTSQNKILTLKHTHL